MVESCSSVWSPLCSSHIKLLESVQRRFTKRLPGLRLIPYAQRLIFLDLPSLETRRLRADLILCYKILHQLIDININDFLNISSNVRTRGHMYKLVVPLAMLSELFLAGMLSLQIL